MPDTSNHGTASFRRMGRFLAVIAWAVAIFVASSRSNLRVSDDDVVDLILRKLGHAIVFAILAILVARARYPDGIPPRAGLVGVWAVTTVYAISDEWHQTLVIGRVGSPIDVGIDAAGAAAALVLFTRRRRSFSGTPTPTSTGAEGP